jgi:CHASE1-domain containing sensor protein
VDPITAALNIGGKVIDALKGFGIIPDKDTEIKVQAAVQDALKQAQDFYLQYFTATIGKDEPWYSPNKLIRPITTFIALGFYIYARTHGIELQVEDKALIGGIIGFWFTGRTVEKLFGKQ